MIFKKDILLNFRCNDIKKLVVKIRYSINEKKEYRQSTGVILRPTNETNYFFVLTTKHSFKEEDEQSFKDVEIDKLNFDDVTIIYNDEHSFQPLKMIDTVNDLLILVVESSFCIDNNIENIKILDSEYTSCGFIGYADVSKGRLKCFDKCTHSIDHDEMIFEINSNTVLQSSNNDETLATIGLSGSGLFTTVNNNYMLTGILSKVITDNNSFDCVNLSYLLKDIPLDEYGDIEIVSLETISTEPSNQLHQETNIIPNEYKIIIQEQVTKEFQTLKEKYLDGSTKQIQEWIDEIKISSKWNILTDKEKAKIVYEEARISIEINQFHKTKSLVKEIQNLDSSLYVNRLLSWIEIDKNNLDKAILLLDNNEVATLNQKIALYLDNQDFTNAKATLDSMQIEDKNYDTYRIQAIYELYSSTNNNLSYALKNINKSLELKKNYLEAKRVKAIILFYKATLFNILPNLRPPMMQTNTLKVDKESQQSVQEAILLLNELIEIAPNYRDLLWVNSILWASNRKKAIDNIKKLYEDEKYKDVAIQFILIYNLDIDIQDDMKLIESNENIQVYDIDKLIRYYFREKNKNKIFELLDKYKNSYLEQELFPNWCEHYVNALFTFKSAQDALDFIDKNKFERSEELKAQIYKNTNDYSSAYTIYEKIFKETKDPFYRFAICDMKAYENSWEYITKYTDYLLENFQTEKVVELVILGEINSQNFTKTKQLIDIWLPSIKNHLRRDSLLRIKAICVNIMGNPKSAIEVYEENNFMKSDEDTFNLSYLYRKTASYDKLEDLALKSVNNQNLHIDTKIQIASMVDNNSLLLKEIVKKNDIEKSNFFVIQNGSNIRLHRRLKDNEMLFCWDGGEKLMTLGEEREKKQKYTLYQNSDISTHHLDLEFFNRFSNTNKEIVYTRSAKRFNFIEIDNIEQVTLFLDITSLLLLFSIDMLDKVINSFSKVYLPSNIHLILKDINVSNELVSQIKTYFSLEKLFYSPEINPENITEKEDLSNIMISIYTVIDFEKENSLVCVDDRYVNSFEFNKNEKQIISTNDILFTFYKNHKIEKNKYYSLLLEMRKRKYLYILISSEEIIYQLKNCKIIDNQIQETEELKTLKESLNFMIQNFKYIKPFSKEETHNNQYAEPFFVTTQEREIHHSIIELWNEEFGDEEDRYVYLNWIMDNFFTLNMAFFIKNKLAHNTDISKVSTIVNISSLFTQGITILSDDNQKSYFNWIYHNYIYNFFESDFELFQECIDNIALLIIQSFLERETTKYEKSLIGNLILNFPEKIKEALYKKQDLMDKLFFRETITVGHLDFENKNFISKIKKVVNGSKEEQVTSDCNSNILLKSTIIKHQKHIQIKNNEDKGLIDDTFMILSTSKQKRKKVLESNPKWFNMSNKKKKEVISNLNNIKNHNKRIEALYSVQKDSNFYENIERDLENQKINFENLLPHDINILLNHFRIDSTFTFDKALKNSIEILLQEENILKTIDTIHHFPITLPKNIINILMKKNEEEQQEIFQKFIKTSGTPISTIQLLKVLIKSKNDKFKKIIVYLTKRMFTEKFQLELKAFFMIHRYIRQEFNIRYTTLNDDIKLALIWGHSNKLMKYFNVYPLAYNGIIKEFKAHSNRLTLELFRPESQYNNDILNKSFTYEEFVLTAIDYITDSDFDYFKNTIIEEKLKNLLNTQDLYIKFTPPTHINYNLTNSFLEFNTSQLPELKNNIESLEKSLLTDNIPLFTSFLTIKYGFTPLEEALQNQLISYIKEYQSNEETLISLRDLLLFTKQLKNINNKQIFKLVIQYIKDISIYVQTQEEREVLLEILVYLPIAQTNSLKKRLKLMAKYIRLCNALDNDEIKFMVNRFLMELPLEYSKYFLPLKFDTLNEREILTNA